MSVTRIVITGGPCSGKTAALSRIQRALSGLGYTVLIVPDTEKELIKGGVAPWTCRSNLDFQKCRMHLQLDEERAFAQAAESMDAEKLLIICDGGAMDGRAYMNAEEFTAVLEAVGSNEVELRDDYDAVFHLVTTAKGAEAYYDPTRIGEKRVPSLSEAVALDDALISAWTGNPHLRVIDNSTGFEEKLERLLKEICFFLGEPEPLEIERKFLIEYPDLTQLEKLPYCRKVDIVQTYLKDEPGVTSRVRQRGGDGHYIYIQTTKKHITDMKRVEIERRLTKDEYLELLKKADPECHPIRKSRYCIAYKGQYFELDVFPFWNDRAVLEIEMSDENAEIRFPEWLRIIREVTEEPQYKNAVIAQMQL